MVLREYCYRWLVPHRDERLADEHALIPRRFWDEDVADLEISRGNGTTLRLADRHQLFADDGRVDRSERSMSFPLDTSLVNLYAAGQP